MRFEVACGLLRFRFAPLALMLRLAVRQPVRLRAPLVFVSLDALAHAPKIDHVSHRIVSGQMSATFLRLCTRASDARLPSSAAQGVGERHAAELQRRAPACIAKRAAGLAKSCKSGKDCADGTQRGCVISPGCTSRSNSSAVTKPSLIASSRKVVP